MLQQLGRGTRKAPGKDCLLVFDFIDNTSRYAQAMSAHRLFKKAPVSSWGSSCCSQKPVGRRSWKVLSRGKAISDFWPYICGLKKYEAIDIFRWQDEVQDMYQATRELEAELGIGESVVRRWVETGKLTPDHSIPIGERLIPLFQERPHRRHSATVQN